MFSIGKITRSISPSSAVRYDPSAHTFQKVDPSTNFTPAISSTLTTTTTASTSPLPAHLFYPSPPPYWTSPLQLEVPTRNRDHGSYHPYDVGRRKQCIPISKVFALHRNHLPDHHHQRLSCQHPSSLTHRQQDSSLAEKSPHLILEPIRHRDKTSFSPPASPSKDRLSPLLPRIREVGTYWSYGGGKLPSLFQSTGWTQEQASQVQTVTQQ